MALDNQTDLQNHPAPGFEFKGRHGPHRRTLTQVAALGAEPKNPQPAQTSNIAAKNGQAADPAKQVVAKMAAANTPVAKAGIVLDALANNDPKMGPKIVEAALGATAGADRAEVMGKLMGNDNYKGLVLNAIEADPSLGKFDNADLRGVSHDALQALPYNKLQFEGKTKFPPNLDLRNNGYVKDAIFDGFEMPGVTFGKDLPKSAKNANFGQQAVSHTTYNLMANAGGNVWGMSATMHQQDGHGPSVTAATPVQSNKTVLGRDGQQKNWAKLPTAPGMGKPA